MRQVFLAEDRTYSLREGDKPTIQEDTDVIVKVTATTVCGSDVHMILGHVKIPLGFSLGHEFVGVVHELGSAVKNLKMGDRVVAPAAVSCYQCDKCRGHEPQACQRGGIFGSGTAFGNDLGGGQAEFVRVPCADVCLPVIADGVSDAQALAVGDVLSTGWTGVMKAVSAPGETLVVFGVGPVGLSAIHTARLAGVSQVIAVDVLPDRLEVAKRLGADHLINAARENVGDVVLTLTKNRGAEAIIDAAGVKSSIGSWASVAAPGAKVALLATSDGPTETPFDILLFKGVTIWTGFGDLSHMAKLLEHIRKGHLDPSAIFTETYTLDQIERAIDDMIQRKPGLIKPLVTVA